MYIHVREPKSYGDRWDMFQCKQLLRLKVQIVDFLATEYLTLNEEMRSI